MVELLKQKQYIPMSVEKQVVLLFAGAYGFIDDIPIERIAEFETKYLEYMETIKGKLLQMIKKEGKLNEKLIEDLKETTADFKKNF
jgi:F0F1-type ATP synthase alpha subunit